MKYVDIVIDNKSKMTDTYYTYKCEYDDISIGQKVFVPFAKSKSLREGYVMDIRDNDERNLKFRFIDHIDENIILSQEMINTAIWMKKRYLVKYIDGIRCFTPPGNAPLKKIKEKERVLPEPVERTLTDEQKNAVSLIEPCLVEKKHDIFLLHGVTSSGKTEVYIRLIEKVIARGRNCIMMVPEISLTNQVIERFEKRFGSDIIAVMHSRLTKAQRYVQWQKVKSGQVRIVIGARSAVFAPLDDIGLIVLDEEHESTYKSDQTPKYETVEVAIKRAKAFGGLVVLGSATPSVVSYERAKQGIYKLIEMKKRYNENLMPAVYIADMKKEMKKGNMGIFSNLLYDETYKCLESGKQIILFLNRRGYSTYLSCSECGHTLKCPSCGISLTYHKDLNGLSCHFCGRTMPVINKCSDCGGDITFGGTGTQKLEEEIEKLFAGYKVDRLDLDSIRKKGSLDRILSNFSKGKTDILLGTQLVAKGLDFNNVGLVGIIAADNSLSIPDYRSAERTFQLITQASGRAGRGDDRGKVIIQTFDPDNYAILAASGCDYKSFAEKELGIRKLMSYPPYSDILRIIFTGEDENAIRETADQAYRFFITNTGRANVFKATACQISKVDNIYRYSMMIKSPKGMRNLYLGAYNSFIESLNNKCKVNIGIDINPYSFV